MLMQLLLFIQDVNLFMHANPSIHEQVFLLDETVQYMSSARFNEEPTLVWIEMIVTFLIGNAN